VDERRQIEAKVGMELFGIGPLELLFILIIALIVLGPRDMVKAGNSLGRLMRKTILSPTWMKIQREIRTLPYQMMREAGLEEEDLRIDTGLDSALKDIPNKITSFPEQNQAPQPTLPAENSTGQPLDVPTEWLGLPAPDLQQPNGNPPSEGQPPLAEWTSAPDIGTSPGVPGDDMEEAKDAT
jgi:sec-independent protein translocase protein TatB